MRLTQTACSYFKRYVEREMRRIVGHASYRPLGGWRVHRFRKEWMWSEHRPWTTPAQMKNAIYSKTKMPLVQPINDWMIFKGDRVEVLVGKDKGKIGLVNSVVRERNWVFVEGLHTRFRVQNKTRTSPGMLREEEQPLLVPSEVALVDPSDQRATDVHWRHDDKGERVRVSLRSGRVIPLTHEARNQREDFVYRYKDNPEKDTMTNDLKKVTFVPKLCTFETDILDKNGIKDDRKPARTYWY